MRVSSDGLVEVFVVQGLEGASGLFIDKAVRALVGSDAAAHPPGHAEVKVSAAYPCTHADTQPQAEAGGKGAHPGDSCAHPRPGSLRT